MTYPFNIIDQPKKQKTHKNAKSSPSITAITIGGITKAKIIPTTKPIMQKTAIFL